MKIMELTRERSNKSQKLLSNETNDEDIQTTQEDKLILGSSLKNRAKLIIDKQELILKLEKALDSKVVSYLSKQLEEDFLEEKNKSAPSKPITSSTQKDVEYFNTLEQETIEKIKKWSKKRNTNKFELYLNLHLGDIEPQHWVAGKIIFHKDSSGKVSNITTISLDSCGPANEKKPRVNSAKKLLQKISKSIFPQISDKDINFIQGIEKELQNSGAKSCGYYMVDLKYKAATSQELMLDGKFKTEIQGLEKGYLDSGHSKAMLLWKLTPNPSSIETYADEGHKYNDEDYEQRQFKAKNEEFESDISEKKIIEEKKIERSDIVDILPKKTESLEKVLKPKSESNQEILQEKINVRKQVAEKLPNISEEEKTKFIESGKIPEEIEKDELKYYPRSTPQPNQETCEMDCSIVYDEKDKNIKYIQMCGNNEPINKPFRIQIQRGESASDIILQIQKEGLSPFKDKMTILEAKGKPNLNVLEINRIISHIDLLRKKTYKSNTAEIQSYE